MGGLQTARKMGSSGEVDLHPAAPACDFVYNKEKKKALKLMQVFLRQTQNYNEARLSFTVV